MPYLPKINFTSCVNTNDFNVRCFVYLLLKNNCFASEVLMQAKWYLRLYSGCSHHQDNSTTQHILYHRWSVWPGNWIAIYFLQTTLVAYILFMPRKYQCETVCQNVPMNGRAIFIKYIVIYITYRKQLSFLYQRKRWLVMSEEKAFEWSIYKFFSFYLDTIISFHNDSLSKLSLKQNSYWCNS